MKKKNGALDETREEDKNRSITTKKISAKSVPSSFQCFLFVMTWITSWKEEKKRTNKIIQFHRTGPGRNFLILKKLWKLMYLFMEFSCSSNCLHAIGGPQLFFYSFWRSFWMISSLISRKIRLELFSKVVLSSSAYLNILGNTNKCFLQGIKRWRVQHLLFHFGIIRAPRHQKKFFFFPLMILKRVLNFFHSFTN